MQDPNYRSIYGDQSSSSSPVKRLLQRITIKVVFLYGAAAFFLVDFFINDLPRASTTKDMFIAIVVFFASIMLLALLAYRDRRKREQQAQLDMEDTGSSPHHRRSTIANWVVGLLLLSLFIALTVSNFVTSNPLVVEVMRSIAVGNLVFVLVNWANKARRGELEPSLNAPYRDRRGQYD
jgi:uncharacterized membrane protein YbjE (DUF340 family)